MPDNETNCEDNTNKRPKRRAAQRTYVSYENTSVWNEDKDLKRALLASLQDVKKTVPKSTSIYEQNGKNESNVEKKTSKSDVLSKLNSKTGSQSIVCKESQSLVVDNSCSLLSLAAHRRARVSAQRKFAQSSGFTTNSPVSTPIKTGFVASNNVVDLFPNQKPKTEDFLTFLCLRRSPILPPNLDFIRIESERKVIEENKRETDSENISNDELETNDKYTTCRLRASVDRRGSSSSTVSKATSLSSRASIQISNRKKSENQRNDNKIQNLKRNQSISSENSFKNIGTDLNQNIKQNLKTISQKSDELKSKTFDSLKQKYKQKRFDKKSLNPSKSLTSNKKNDSKFNKINNFNEKKNSETIGIQTRQQLRNHSKNNKEYESKDKELSMNSDSGPSERVLRSNKSIIVSHNSDSNNKKTSKTCLLQKNNTKKNKSLNSSQIGIRPKKRKAKPVVPLIDYYFDSEFDSDSEKKNTRSEDNSNSQEFKLKSKNNLKDNKIKKISKVISEESRTHTSSRPKGTKVSTNKSKTSLSSDSRRLTRSSRPLSPPKDSKDLERERQIKERIIAIERKHKRLRRCPSNQSLHSSTSSSSSSSSESLPNSLSSSSSINNTRLTRSLEQLKKIRDIAAKLKKEQNKKEDKTKTTLKNAINSRKNRQNSTKRQNSSETKTNESFDKNAKINKSQKTNNSAQRTVTRSMRDSVVSAMSDTDCDTEGDDCQECDNLISDLSATEDSMASILDDDMERASIVIQDMAEDINTLLVNSSENDLQYGSTEHIQGLMTCEFSGAFSEETVTTASAILLPSECHSEYSYVQTDDTQIRSTVDASTNTTEEDILSSLSSDDTQTDSQYEYSSQTLSVGTQTTVNTSVQTDGPLEC